MASFIACELVACVVKGEKQNAVTLVSHLHGLKNELAGRRREDIAIDLDVQHTLANVALLCRLVTGAAVGNDRNTIGILQILADDEVILHDHGIAECESKTNEFFISDGFRAVNKFFHCHFCSLLDKFCCKKSCLQFCLS